MMWLSSGFIFRRGTSRYHRLDPRVKLLISVLMFATTLLVRTLYELAAVLTFMIAVAAIATGGSAGTGSAGTWFKPSSPKLNVSVAAGCPRSDIGYVDVVHTSLGPHWSRRTRAPG